MNNDSHINKIISHLASAATTAADGVGCAVKAAGQAVGSQYDRFKLNMDLAKLKQEQDELFTEIGHSLYQLKNGNGEGAATQQQVDDLLEMAAEKQKEIDLTLEKLNSISGVTLCPNCAKVVDKEDIFCSACGTKLPEIEKEEPQEPQVEVVEPEVVENPEDTKEK